MNLCTVIKGFISAVAACLTEINCLRATCHVFIASVLHKCRWQCYQQHQFSLTADRDAKDFCVIASQWLYVTKLIFVRNSWQIQYPKGYWNVSFLKSYKMCWLLFIRFVANFCGVRFKLTCLLFSFWSYLRDICSNMSNVMLVKNICKRHFPIYNKKWRLN